jgi:hypothetical protein
MEAYSVSQLPYSVSLPGPFREILTLVGCPDGQLPRIG